MPYGTTLTRGFIAEKTTIDDAGCWIWSLSVDRWGYGLLGANPNGQRLAHRLSYELHIGPIPEGLTIDHLCRTPLCVNPQHLEAVTMAENAARKPRLTHLANGRPACSKGHPKDPGKVDCRICNNAAAARYRERRRAAA